MGKRGVRPKGKVKIKWSPNFAYAIGLLATDGCLQKDGRHIDLTSKDEEQLRNFLKALNADFNITLKHSSLGKKYQRVQFSDVLFYHFLLGIGFTPAKSKTIGVIKIPEKYFFDFLRGCFDGDGSFYSYYDPRWKSSFMFYTTFISASKEFIDWLRKEIHKRVDAKGHVTKDSKGSTYQLRYAKRESLKILKKMYYTTTVLCLSRKREKVAKALKTGGY
jgi:hypothetical protein